MRGIIYKFTSPSGKVYIGQTISRYRRNQHLQEARSGSQKPFYKAIRKYGFENFKYEILEEVFENTLEEINSRLDELEIHYIAMYKSTDERFGYNLCYGGRTNRGYHHSEEYKNRLSQQQKGRKMPPGCVEKSAKNRIGKPMNKVSYQKFQLLNKKRAKKIGLYNLKGELIKTFDSISKASVSLSCCKSNIQLAIKRNFTVYKKYKIKILTTMTTITVKQLAAAKRTAMNVLPLTNKKAKLQAKIAEMEAEIEDLNGQIDAQQGYVKSFAAGLTTEQLLVRNKETKVFEANPDVITWDETNRVWVVKEEEDLINNAPVTTEPTAEEIAAAEEAAREEEIARLEAEQQAAEEARQAEIQAAKERLSAAKPQSQEEPEVAEETVVDDNDPFA